MIRISENHLNPFIQSHELDYLEPQLEQAFSNLKEKTGPGNDFLGWVDLPINYDKEEFQAIKLAAEKIQKQSDVLLVVGIGGSYLGARAVIEALKPAFPIDNDTEIIFVGHQISGDYLNDLLKYLDNKEVSLNVISKSGTTTEPAIAFRILRDYLIQRYGESSKERIFVTTDKARGALKELANQVGYQTFVVPDDIGGRYSVLTAVGLLPIAVAGISIEDLMQGAAEQREEAIQFDLEKNQALRYAGLRNVLLRRGYKTEILVNYEPGLMFFNEWWKQLYGESEGKDGKGIFPAAVDLTTDLHSMGQYIQDGSRTLFETVINIEKSQCELKIEEEPVDLDGLNYLAGKSIDFVNKSAMNGTILAHTDGNVPNLIINVPEQNEFYLGQLFYLFEFACGVSGYLLGVNPFNQPGVESYKRNMFALLGKSGYEKEREELLARLNTSL